MATKKTLQGVLLYLGYLVMFLFIVFPLYWIVTMSFKEFRDIIAYPPRFLFKPTLANYQAILGLAGDGAGFAFLGYLKNSIIVSSLSVALSALVSIPAAYAFARFPMRLKDNLSFTILSLRFAPEILIIIPLYAVFSKLNLYDTYLGLILVHQLITLPLTIWILRGFFAEVPVEIEESAKVDGCGPWRILTRISLPVILPGVAGAMIVSFVFSWNNLLFGLVLSGPKTQPVTVGILQTMHFDQINWGWMAAAIVFSIIPGILVSGYFGKYLVKGLTEGAVKQ